VWNPSMAVCPCGCPESIVKTRRVLNRMGVALARGVEAFYPFQSGEILITETQRLPVVEKVGSHYACIVKVGLGTPELSRDLHMQSSVIEKTLNWREAILP
jgi:hypothetical protein